MKKFDEQKFKNVWQQTKKTSELHFHSVLNAETGFTIKIVFNELHQSQCNGIVRSNQVFSIEPRKHQSTDGATCVRCTRDAWPHTSPGVDSVVVI